MNASNRHTCGCDTPPGGSVTCSVTQIAICRVKGGQVIAECIDPPNHLAFNPMYEDIPLQQADIAWLVEAVTESSDLPPSTISIAMLLSGRFEDPDRDYIATFRFPEHIQRKLDLGGGQIQGGGHNPTLPSDDLSGLTQKVPYKLT